VSFYGKLCPVTDAAKTLELPDDVAQAVKRGERVMVTGNGVTLAAIVPIEELRRLEALEAEKAHGELEAEQNGLDLFISMAGQVKSGEHDVSADKYRHLAEAYATKP
jgi:prevent-host-death family protein